MKMERRGYRWGEGTRPGSWRWAVKPWWGSVRTPKRPTNCAARSECLLGAVDLRWIPETNSQCGQDNGIGTYFFGINKEGCRTSIPSLCIKMKLKCTEYPSHAPPEPVRTRSQPSAVFRTFIIGSCIKTKLMRTFTGVCWELPKTTHYYYIISSMF